MDNHPSRGPLHREPLFRIVVCDVSSDGKHELTVETDRATRDGALVKSWALEDCYLTPAQLVDITSFIDAHVYESLLINVGVQERLLGESAF